MKLDFNLIMRILMAVGTVEQTIKAPGATKREKALDIIIEGLDAAQDISPKAKDAIGQTIDAVVTVTNAVTERRD